MSLILANVAQVAALDGTADPFGTTLLSICRMLGDRRVFLSGFSCFVVAGRSPGPEAVKHVARPRRCIVRHARHRNAFRDLKLRFPGHFGAEALPPDWAARSAVLSDAHLLLK